jgi:NADH dehydrogenase [ubiquinone] 1 alpha subcomplex assembly factor 7
MITVQWHDNLASVPTQSHGKHIPTFIVCQELLDALPIHVFQKTRNGWRERLVDVALNEIPSDTSPGISVKERTSSNKAVLPTIQDINEAKLYTQNGEKRPRFRFVLAPNTTPAVTSLLHVNTEGRVEGLHASTIDSADEGSIIEVCPEAMILAQDMALRIESCTGAALIIDYGEEGCTDSLRAFNKHKQVSVLSSPGMVDVTADVDFKALREAVNVGLESIWGDRRGKQRSKPVAFGPVSQGKFLASMGAMERSIMLIEDEKTTDEQAEEIYNALERLVSPEQMGERYKVMAIAHKKDGIFPPPGF